MTRRSRSAFPSSWLRAPRLATDTTRQRVLLSVGAVALVWAEASIHAHSQWPLASAVLVIAALGLARLLGAPPVESDDVVIMHARSQWRGVAGVVVAFAGMAVAAGATNRLAEHWEASFDRWAPLAVAGIALWSVGIALADWRERPFTIGRDAMPGWERWALLGIVVLAFALRFYRYGYFPPPGGICAIEEPQTGQAGWDILQGARPWEFLLDRWLAAAGLAIGGANLTALRVPFTIFSALTVVPLYFLLRCLVSRTVALAVALLFVVCHWHLIYARYAHNIYFTTFLVVVVLYLLVRARRDSRLAFYPWIGFIAASTLFAYAGYRGTTILVGIFLLGSLIVDVRRYRAALTPSRRQRTRTWLQRQLLASGIVALAYLVPAIPLLTVVNRSPGGLTYYVEAANRSLADSDYYSQSFAHAVKQRLVRLHDSAMIFHHVGEDWATMNLPRAPMLDPATGALFTVALCYCLGYPRRRQQGYIATVFLLMMLGGAVFVHNLDVRRLQQVIPIIFVLIALLLERVREVVGTNARGQRVFLGLLGITLVVGYAHNIDVYFRKMINAPEVRAGFHNQYTVAIEYLRTLPNDAYLLLVADIDNFFLPSDYEWLRGSRVPGMMTTDLQPLLANKSNLPNLPAPWRGRSVYLLMEDPYSSNDLVAFLTDQFPYTECEAINSPDHAGVHFIGCHVVLAESRPSEPNIAEPNIAWIGQGGVRARYYHGEETEPFLDRIEPVIDYALMPDACRISESHDPAPCRVTWEATWTVEQELQTFVRFDFRQSHAELRIDGVAAAGNALHLTPGAHTITITAHMETNESPGLRVRWRAPGANRLALLPFYQITKPR